MLEIGGNFVLNKCNNSLMGGGERAVAVGVSVSVSVGVSVCVRSPRPAIDGSLRDTMQVDKRPVR